MERRTHPRYPVHLPIAFTNDEIREEGITRCVSEAGCMVQADGPVEIGTLLTLQILMPDHYWPMTVDRAIVRWSSEQRFGMQFLLVQPRERARLARIVKGGP